MFSQQLDGGDHIPFMSGNILVITELVSLVNCMCTIYMQILRTVFLANFTGHYLSSSDTQYTLHAWAQVYVKYYESKPSKTVCFIESNISYMLVSI